MDAVHRLNYPGDLTGDIILDALPDGSTPVQTVGRNELGEVFAADTAVYDPSADRTVVHLRHAHAGDAIPVWAWPTVGMLPCFTPDSRPAG